MTEAQYQHAAVALERNATASRVASHYILSLGSTLMIYLICLRYLPDYLPYPDISVPLAAYALAGIWYFMVERAMHENSLFVCAYFLTEKEERRRLKRSRKAMAFFSIAVVIFQVFGTGGLSVWSSDFLSKKLTTKADRTVEITTTDNTISSYDKDVAALREQIAAAKRDDAQLIADAKAAGQQRIDAAPLSLGRKMLELSKAPGDQWAGPQIQRKKEQAAAWAANHLAEAKKNLAAPALRQQLADYMANNSGTRNKVSENLSNVLQTDQEAYMTQSANYLFGLVVINILALIIHLGSTVVVVGCRLERKGPIVDGSITLSAALVSRVKNVFQQLIAFVMPKAATVQQATSLHQITIGTLPVLPTVKNSPTPTPATAVGSNTVAPPTPTKTPATPTSPTTVGSKSVAVAVAGKNCGPVVPQATHSKTPATPASPTAVVSKSVAPPTPTKTPATPALPTVKKAPKKEQRTPITTKNGGNAKLFTKRLKTLDTRLRMQWERYHQYKMEAESLEGPKRDKKLQYAEDNLGRYQETLSELEESGVEYTISTSEFGDYGQAKLHIKE